MTHKSQRKEFWNVVSDAELILKERSQIENTLTKLNRLKSSIVDNEELFELAIIENDEQLINEIKTFLQDIEIKLKQFEIELMFSDDIDLSDAIISINAGQGGSDAQNWTEMLFRMYSRWCEKKSFVIEIIDQHVSTTGGLLGITATIQGQFSYGLLRSEMGVHRIIRISPFGGGRHTSFASVAITPDLGDVSIEIVIRDEDLKIDTYRSSGAGGQHVNKTESAIRITHLPSGIVVACQTERSQHTNKAKAMKVLRGKLYEKARQERESEFSKSFESGKKQISFGSQVRTYTFNPYTMAKDERTDHKETNVHDVLDGDLDPFISAYLLGDGT